ncbi:MAG TPA: TrbC/VirB2 family protein [Verrucomicrobiae bacterium]|nr:TrbC/VirB2 family protein [Verrucomicrobiae bacterium]
MTVIALATVLLNGEVAYAADAAAQAENFIKEIVKTAIGIVGAVAVAFVVYGGFKYVTSTGKPDKLEEAKSTLKYAGIGLVIVLAAYTLVDFVAGIARSSFGG